MIENKTGAFDIENTILQHNSSGLDKDQCIAAKETQNVVVSAGAGSGKTTVLASRFAYLVEAKNVPVEKILTLTFTKKAAAEMKGRIFNGLKNHARGMDIKNKYPMDKNQPNYDKILSRAQNAVENLDKAHVQTLDSYFSEIAKKGAHFYGINPNFSLDDEKIAGTIRFKATNFLLQHLDNPAITEFSQTVKIQDMAKDLFSEPILHHSTIFSPIDFEGGLEKQKKEIEKEYLKLSVFIQEEIDQTTAKIQTKAKPTESEVKLLALLSNVASCPLPTVTESYIEKGDPKNLKDFLLAVEPCIKNRSNPGVELKSRILNAYEELCRICNFIDGYKVQKELTSLLSQFQKDVIETKRSSGILTFNDVSNLAYKILLEHKDIRLLEQQKFDAIMIDEFQDDNQLQCDVLLMLSDIKEKYDEQGNYLLPKLTDEDLNERLDPNKLFFVGDEKQSIYLFRGADVSVFRNLKNRLKNLNLGTNYRSDAQLIKGFNTIFGGYKYPENEGVDLLSPAIFMTKEKFAQNQIPIYEAEYEKVLVPENKQQDSKERSIIFANYVPPQINEEDDIPEGEKKEDEVSEKVTLCEAQWVAKEIDRLVNVEKKYRYKDIALLFRTATPTPQYEQKLLQHKIPYSTEVYKGFFSDGPINDILALLRLCVYPNDIHSFARLIHSPFINLSLEQTQVVLAYATNHFEEPFSQELIDVLKKDNQTEVAEKIQGGQTLYKSLCEKLKSEKLTKTISYLWYELGYRYETLWNRNVGMFNSLYDMLFEMAHQAEQETQGLAVFLDEIKLYEENDKKLDGLDVILEAEDCVNIMTIHASKGLEFPVVFVCATTNASSGKDNDNVRILPDFGMALSVTSSFIDINNYFIDKDKKTAAALATAELRRLTYVAFTRAEKQLYIVGNYNGIFQKDDKTLTKRFEVHPEKENTFEVMGRRGALIRPYENPNTIYKMLLPLLNNYVHQEIPTDQAQLEDNEEPLTIKSTSDASPFEYVGNPEDFDNQKISTSTKDKTNTPEAKKAFIEEKDYSSIPENQIISADEEPEIYLSPSKIPHEDNLFNLQNESAATNNKDYSDLKYADPIYNEINNIVLSTLPKGVSAEKLIDTDDSDEVKSSALSPAFGFNNFGTIAHAFMEATVKQTTPVIKQDVISGLNGNQEKLQTVINICQDMVLRYKGTDLFTQAVASEWKQTEYDFRSWLKKADGDGIIINGQIDLVYKNDSSSPYKYTIVDYKTNQTIEPEIYYNQLACYRDAISKMLGCKAEEIRCVLYYLRFGKEVEIKLN